MSQQQSKDWEIQKLTNRHRLVLYRVLQGMSQVDIAKELGYHPEHIGKICRSPLFKAEVAKAHKEVKERVSERITNASELSVELLEDILVNDDVDLRLRASTAEKMLDRAGHGAKQEINVQHNVINLIEQAYREKQEAIKVDVIEGEVVSDS